jgi:hypothetical protein
LIDFYQLAIEAVHSISVMDKQPAVKYYPSVSRAICYQSKRWPIPHPRLIRHLIRLPSILGNKSQSLLPINFPGRKIILLVPVGIDENNGCHILFNADQRISNYSAKGYQK